MIQRAEVAVISATHVQTSQILMSIPAWIEEFTVLHSVHFF